MISFGIICWVGMESAAAASAEAAAAAVANAAAANTVHSSNIQSSLECEGSVRGSYSECVNHYSGSGRSYNNG